MNIDKLIEIEKRVFPGWDFKKINQKTKSQELTWDYKKIVDLYLKKEDTLLDMGTGGGEFLLTLNHPYKQTTVTEAYPPNVKLCKERLAPLGITVCENETDEKSIPKNKTFTMIINRHDAYHPVEVYNALEEGGYFITQQVGGLNNLYLSQKVLGYDYKNFEDNQWDLKHAKLSLESTGFKILFAEEAMSQVQYFDLETLVAYVSIIKWEFPGFNVKTNIDQLRKIEEEIKHKGYVEGQEHRFIIVAKK
ncbi:MAG: SAM-dependent methyltransferase [Candidatus Izemoplasmatales bacterium]